MADDAAYNATMNTLCHVYVDRDTLLNCVAKETSERSRYLMVAAALWSTANESALALSELEHNAPHLQALRQSIATNISNTRVTSYAFYCNAGFGQPNQDTFAKDVELSQANIPDAWDAAVQSVQPNGDDAIMNLFDDIPCTP